MNHLVSVYENPMWGYIQEYMEEGMTDTFFYDSEYVDIKYSFIKRKAGVIDGEQFYDIITARGENGPIVTIKKVLTNEKMNEEICNYMEKLNCFLHKEHIIAEYIRFSPWKECSEFFCNYYQICKYGNLYEVDLSNDFFYLSFDSKIRNEIRKAQKNDVIIEIDKNGRTIEDFINLYAYTIQKNDISTYYLIDTSFIRRYFECLNEGISIYNAYFENVLISSAIMLDSKDIRHYHFSANNPDYARFQGNSLILYRAALDAQEKKIKLFDLGGAMPNSGLERYKKQFIKENGIFSYNVGTRIVNADVYNKLVEMAGGARKNYFPQYRK